LLHTPRFLTLACVKNVSENSAAECSYARQSEHYDARYQGIVAVEYPIHPLFGQELQVVRRVRCGVTLFFEVQVGQELATIPEWMTRKDACQLLQCGIDPVCDFHALQNVRDLLEANGW